MKLPFLRKFLTKLRRKTGEPVSIPITTPVAIGLSVILACAAGWAFFMGYMVGKGQNPETEVQAMAGLSREDDGDQASETDAPPLMASAGQVPSPLEPLPESFNKPQGDGLTAWEAPPPPTPAPKKAAVPKPKPQTDTTRYDYSYQTAALKSSQDANKLRARLEKAGIRATTQKSGKVYLVVASLRGTTSDAANLRQKLKTLGLGQPVQLSKKPVPAKAAKKK